jgi:hypothetical protein
VVKRLVLVALAACGNDTTVITPIIDVPANDTASAFPLDSITLSAAHDGADLDITSATFTKGQTVAVGGIPFGDDLVLHMSGRVATSDVAYGRTCAFSIDQNAALPEPHLYFSRTVKFGELAFTPLLRLGGAAVTYHDGSAILLGGMSPDMPTAAVTDVERFDPGHGQYGALTTISDRIGSVVALLGTSTETHVTVIGGIDPTTGQGATFVETIEVDNPADRRVERIDDSSLARVGLTATTLTNGNVIVMGGSGAGSGSGSNIDDPSQTVGEITLVAGNPVVRPAHQNLLHGRWQHTATRLGDDVGAPVLVAGGLGSDNGTGAVAPVAEGELFNPLTDKFIAFPNGSPKLNVPRWGHSAVLMPDGSVLIIGGVTRNSMGVEIGVRQLELYTLVGGFVAPTNATLPDNAGVIDFTATTLPDGRVLLTGGRTMPGGPALATAFIIQLNTDTSSVDIVATDRMTVPRAGHAATLLCDGTVLISGGTDTPAPAERYNPPALNRR